MDIAEKWGKIEIQEEENLEIRVRAVSCLCRLVQVVLLHGPFYYYNVVKTK